jgi:hypothetical protein
MSDLLSGLMIASLAIGPYLGGMLMEFIHIRINKEETHK